MNSKIKNFIVIVSLIAVAAVTGAFAQNKSAGGGRLVGTWDAVVTIRDCATGNAMASFLSIASFNQGGTTIGSTAGIPQSLRTPEHGVWGHTDGNNYVFKFKTFSFLPNGAPNGWSIVEHELELDQGGDSYISEGTARFYAPNGNQVGQGCSSAVGTRFQ